MESNLLDRMGTAIVNRLNAIASEKGIGRWALIREFARGNFPREKQDLDAWVREILVKEYRQIAPEAKRILELETAHYDQRYGGILEELPRYESRKDILFYSEIVAGLLLAATAGWVFARKRLRKHSISYLFVAPPLVSVLVFIFIPAWVALYLSFTEYHPVLPLSSARWVGWRQYLHLISSGDLIRSL